MEVSGLSWKEMGVGMGNRGRCSFDIRWLVWCGGDGCGGRREGGREREERERERFFCFLFCILPRLYSHGGRVQQLVFQSEFSVGVLFYLEMVDTDHRGHLDKEVVFQGYDSSQI